MVAGCGGSFLDVLEVEAGFEVAGAAGRGWLSQHIAQMRRRLHLGCVNIAVWGRADVSSSESCWGGDG